MPKRISIITLVIVAALLFSGCKKEVPSQVKREPLPEEYQKVVEKIKVVERKDGQPSFSLEAGQLIEFRNYTEFRDLSEVITYSDGKAEMKLVANVAEWYSRQKRLVAIGDVFVLAVDKSFEMSTPRIVYETEKEQFEAFGTSVVTTDRYTLIADKFTGNVKENMFYARDNMKLRDNDGLEIEGSSLEFNWKDETYHIKGPIKARVKSE